MKSEFSQFRMKLVKSRGVQEDRTDHTNLFRRSFSGFGVTGHQKVDFHDFWISWKVTLSQNTCKIVPGDPRWSLEDPWVLGPPKMKLEKE